MTLTKPIFYSLAGDSEETFELYEKLVSLIRKEFPDQQCEFLGDPLEGYSEMRLAEKPKHDYTPGARTFFRWGLFYEFNATILKRAFDAGVDIVLVRRFGFDLHMGAVAYNPCPDSLEIHQANIPYGVLRLGLCPPVYVFTDEIDDKLREGVVQYFGLSDDMHRLKTGQAATGQYFPRQLKHSLSISEKARAIVDMIRNELCERKKAAAA